MIQEHKNVTGNKIILVITKNTKTKSGRSVVEKCYWWVNDLYNYKEGDDKVSIMMTEENRNIIAK